MQYIFKDIYMSFTAFLTSQHFKKQKISRDSDNDLEAMKTNQIVEYHKHQLVVSCPQRGNACTTFTTCLSRLINSYIILAMFSSILILVFVIILYYLYKTHDKTSSDYILPKGPPTVPIFGNIFQVLVKPHLKFSKWAYKYGNVYTLNILGSPALVVNDVKTMKQVFGTMESTGKFSFELLDYLSGGTNGVFSAEGEAWQEVRTFTMKALRDCGLSRSSVLEPIVWQSCDEILDWFAEASKNSGVVIPLREKFIGAVGKIAWNVVSRGGQGDKKSNVGKIVLDVVDALQTTTNSGLLFLPWLKHVAPEWSGYNSMIRACSGLHNLVDNYFAERKQYRKNVQVAPEDRNLLDAYLDQWENCTDPKSSFYGEAGWKHCFYSMVQILNAGSETTATTLNWMLNYLVAFPNVQEKLYEEVKQVFGHSKPVLAERKRLPYLDAVIHETLRMSSLIPFGVIHKLLDSVKFDNYYLPKGTFLISNIYHAHNDKAVWGDPENFRPERFLEVDNLQGGRLKDNVVPFQAGKRICPGEGLSRDVMFLMAARLVQKFQFVSVSDKTPQDYIEPEIGYMLFPKQSGVMVKARA